MVNNKKTVLLVDDDTDFLYQTEIQLKNAGFNVLKAQGQKPAEDILKNAKPDLAIIDLMMENVDGGFALAYHIKKIDRDIPVIIVSSVTGETGIAFDASTEEEKNWVKADVFLAKPLRFEQLKKEINKLLEEKANETV